MEKAPVTQTLTSHLSTSVRARSLTDWVTEVLRQAILDGYFEPGERLDRERIADELEVSRTPLREAITALETEGLLQSKPHRGVFVSRVSEKDIREVFAVRALLEAEVAREAAASIPESAIDVLEMSLRDAQEAYDAGDTNAQFEADRLFHQTLCNFTENSLLKEVLEGVNNRIAVVRRFAQMRPGPHVEEFAQEHIDILRAIRQRDCDRAADLMKSHLENSGNRVEELAQSDR